MYPLVICFLRLCSSVNDINTIMARDCSLKKILVHPQKKSEKSKKSKDFFEDLKSVYLIGSEKLL